MNIPIILAHGALGGADELIFLGIAVIFIGMMGVTWFRSQNMEPDLEDEVEPDPKPRRKGKVDAPDRFKLD
ncbi:MAG: hypothetical protein K8L99_06615 [Anaerolineae bacterium]|nr:hypothetical protein [Anaerolineae bacterium]